MMLYQWNVSGHCISKRSFVGIAIVVMVTLLLLSTRLELPFFRSPPDGALYICQSFNGQLGNHIFQYASVYGIAAKNNHTVILGQSDDLVKYFEVPSAKIKSNRDTCETFQTLMAAHCCIFESSFMALNQTNYKIGEYLQSWKYFGHVFNDVRRELTFKPYLKREADYIVENYRAAYSFIHGPNVTMVGVHIRRGDIASEAFIQGQQMMLAPDGYIRRAVDHFLSNFRHVAFIVCSDGMTYARNIMKHRNITAHFVHISPIQDLAILASCDHVLTTVGTFGWWAGFLSNGAVLYYKYPMKEGSAARAEYNYDDFFLPNWIGLE